jgi:Xaa-Pro aminopeptidase
MPPPPPPPPPPPLCFPFNSSKPKRRLSWSSADSQAPLPVPSKEQKMVRHPSFSPTSTFASRPESITFHSDSEKYDEVPLTLPSRPKEFPKLGRSNTTGGTKKSTTSSKWGYGWGVGKKGKEKEKEASVNEKSASQVDLPLYQPVVRRDSKSTQASRSTQRSEESHRTTDTHRTQSTHRTQDTHRTQVSQHSKQSKDTYRSGGSRSTAPKPRPPLTGHTLYPQDSTDTLVGSGFERKINDIDTIRIKPDTTDRLDEMRRMMVKDNLDY